MKLQSFHYKKNAGWSVKTFPDLDSENTLIIVFAAPEFIHHSAPLEELALHYPTSKIIGCSSAGEIVGPRILDHSISVAIAKFEYTSIAITKTEIISPQDSFTGGKEIANNLEQANLRGIFILSDGKNINAIELVKGLNTLNHATIPITGGLASDGNHRKQGFAIFNGKIFTNHVIGVGFYGDRVQIGHGSRGGWDIFKPECTITYSKNNILYELDNKPALAIYKKYLGQHAYDIATKKLLYPLAIRRDSFDTHQLVRTILAVNEDEQSLTFAADMPINHLAQLMHTNFNKLINAADVASDMARKTMHIENYKAKPILAIAISGIGRRLLLGERSEKETASTLDSLPFGTQQIGFYAYGELSPYATGACDLHNQTITLTTVGEK